METLIAWLLLVVHAVMPFVQTVETYVLHTVRPAVEERLTQVPSLVEQVKQNVLSSSSSSSTRSNLPPVIRATAGRVAEGVKNTANVLGSSSVFRTHTPLATLTAEGTLASTNAERYKGGLTLLQSNATLTAIAQKKANDMIARNYFAHESPSGVNVGDLAKQAGYDYLSVGENLAFGDFKNNADLVQAWMNSPGHRANIMNKAYTEVGVAVVQGSIDGEYAWVAVQEFGVPKSVCPIPNATVRATLETLKGQIDTIDKKLADQEVSIEHTSQRSSSYTELVSQYNTAISARNNLVALYSDEAKRYNTLIEEFNTCMSTTLKK